MAAIHRPNPSPWRSAHGQVLTVSLVLSIGGMIAGWSLPSIAQQGMSCADGVKGLTEKRLAAVASLNALAKSGKGKLDPIAACPKLKTLVVLESQLNDYLVKNKDWCQIPDDVINNLAASRAKTQKFAGQACNVAAQIVKAKKDAASQAAAAAQQEAARMPAGPL